MSMPRDHQILRRHFPAPNKARELLKDPHHGPFLFQKEDGRDLKFEPYSLSNFSLYGSYRI